MGEVTVKVNNKPYTVGCADGQEARVAELARIFDEHVSMVVSDVGTIGEVRTFLMAALLLVDEMDEMRLQIEAAEAAQARISAGAFEIERKAAFAITDAAERLEKLVKDA
ncbi:cell division protein ZapA [Asticcacaulis tiandongensis]|uniref:cell division protein ZapA n=1 Tax=Asticcacaulis tiandongensis TaxID=2565365 RepID=UPI0011260431|nr:cell division protein ZapA [Asticcacaulis tiandongensis]